MWKKYVTYMRDNPDGYWFKRKMYGWGWVPVTRQGWMAIGLWLVAVMFFVFTLDENSSPREVAFTFILPVLFLIALLIRVSTRRERSRAGSGVLMASKNNRPVME